VTTHREHLDAETVAAWIDGGLDAASLAAAEAHASNCDRCQMLLATVAKTLPAGEEKAGAMSWRWWFAPLAATAAAVTLWVVVPQEPMQPPASQVAQSDVAQAPSAPAAAARSAPAAGVAEPAAKSAAPPAADARFADAPPLVAAKDQETTEAKAIADMQANRSDAAGLRERQEKREVSAEMAEAPRAAAPPPSTPAVAAAPAEPARDAAAGAQLGAAAQLRKQAAPLEFASPDASHRWRVSAGAVEFSRDGGRTWAPAPLADGASPVAGASPAPQVAWIVGRRGLVLLTTDGTNFTRLLFPESVDLTAVAPLDAQRATVTAIDGRTFETDDAGRNWRIR
jgi:Putative zinc-finger